MSFSRYNSNGRQVIERCRQALSRLFFIAVNRAVTAKYAEQLQQDGVSQEHIDTYVKESEKNATSKEAGVPFSEQALNQMNDMQLRAVMMKLGIKYSFEQLSTVEQRKNYLKNLSEIKQGSQMRSTIEQQQTELGFGEAETLRDEGNDATISVNSFTQNATSNQVVLESLPQAHKEIFAEGKLTHVLVGEVVKGQAKGFHYEGMPEPIGRIIPGTESLPDANGVYSGTVEINGIIKQGNKGESTFFPKHWSPQEVVDAINEAYDSREYKSGNTYFGYTKTNIMIHMYLNHDGKIISAYPIYKEGK